MAESAIRGVCEACGKTYGVPSASRTYQCKACGGAVRVAGASAPSAPSAPSAASAPGAPSAASAPGAPSAASAPGAPSAPAPVRARRAGRSADDGDGDGDDKPKRSSSRRRQAARSSRTGWILVLVLLVVSGVGFGLYKSGIVARAAGAEKDLGKVTESFKADWESGDLDDLAGWYHPDGRAEFRATLDKVAANRGWADGFPAIAQKTERVLEGTSEAPVKGMSLLLWGDELESVTVMWQFEPSRSRWFANAVQLVPPPLGPRVAAFREAWAQSDPAALHPFFRTDAEEKMADLVAKYAEKGGWAQSYPKLGEPEITGEEGARGPTARLLGGSRPESVFPIQGGDGGELLVKWAFRDEDDAWVVTGFKFP